MPVTPKKPEPELEPERTSPAPVVVDLEETGEVPPPQPPPLETMTADELKDSTHPKAPEHPLRPPPAKVDDETAEEGV